MRFSPYPRPGDRALVTTRMIEDGVMEIVMQDGSSGNGMSAEWVGDFVAALNEATADETCKVALLTGLPESFSSGATREMLADISAGRVAPTELRLGRRLIGASMPIIAAAEGHAIGGGFALLMSCDLTVIAEESWYGANFMALGITPGMGMTHLLEDTLGRPLAHELLYSGNLRRGKTFVGSGGFNAITPRAQVRDRAVLLARALAEKPRDNLRCLKRALTLPRRRAFEEASTIESLMHQISLRNIDLDQWGGL